MPRIPDSPPLSASGSPVRTIQRNVPATMSVIRRIMANAEISGKISSFFSAMISFSDLRKMSQLRWSFPILSRLLIFEIVLNAATIPETLYHGLSEETSGEEIFFRIFPDCCCDYDRRRKGEGAFPRCRREKIDAERGKELRIAPTFQSVPVRSGCASRPPEAKTPDTGMCSASGAFIRVRNG